MYQKRIDKIVLCKPCKGTGHIRRNEQDFYNNPYRASFAKKNKNLTGKVLPFFRTSLKKSASRKKPMFRLSLNNMLVQVAL